MRRKQIYLTHSLNEGIKRIAAAEGRTESEVIREALGQYLASKRALDDPWEALVGSIEGERATDSTQVDEVVYGTGKS